MAKINIKFEITIPYGEIIHVMQIKACIDNTNTTNMLSTILLILHKHHIYTT